MATLNNLFAGLVGTAFSVLIRIELSAPGIKYIGDNQKYNSIITAHPILVRFFVAMPATTGSSGIFLIKVISFVMLALAFVFELGKKASKIDTKQSHVHLHSSLIFVIPYGLDAIKQIVYSVYDFFTKTLDLFFVCFKLVSSLLFNIVILMIYLLLGLCLTINYGTFSLVLTGLLIIYYVYTIYQKSDE
ncbi:MAG: hypothetical protein ACRYGR_08240 [Janthinobacterium lividum]